MSEAAATAGFSRLLSDDRLTRRAIGGDQRAFAAIFRRYHQGLYRFCLAIVGNPDDAQDALQNTMAKVLRALPGEEREIELKPWLYRIAHNESIDLLRRRRETHELDVEQVAPGYGLAEDVATRERLRGLLADLRELPERQRETLVMRELSGLEFEEIGAALGTSGAAARQALYEARQSLRQMNEGREMSCEVVARALSDGDGRITRRRDVRAHLRSCPGCRRFGEEIEERQRSLTALSPLPAVAAAGMLHGLLGGTQGAGTGGGLAATLGGGAAKAAGASAMAKSMATVAVVAAIGVTAADKSGVIHLGLPGDRTTKSSSAVPAGSGPRSADPGARGANAGAGGASDGSPARGSSGSSAKASAQAAAVSATHGSAHANAAAGTQHANAAQPSAGDKEDQPPAAAAHGQENAAGHGGGAAAGHGQEVATEPQPSHGTGGGGGDIGGSENGGSGEDGNDEGQAVVTPAPSGPPAATPEPPGRPVSNPGETISSEDPPGDGGGGEDG